jgi:hypothetical protein
MRARPTRIAASIAATAVVFAGFAALTATSPGSQRRAAARGVLRATGQLKPSSSVYTEGALEYVSVRRAGSGVLVLKREYPLGKIKLARRLLAGSYRLTSWTRTCSGNCGYLDPPGYACSRAIRIRAGTTLRAIVVSEVGKHCRITVRTG